MNIKNTLAGIYIYSAVTDNEARISGCISNTAAVMHAKNIYLPDSDPQIKACDKSL